MTPSAALFLTCSMMATSEQTVALSCEDGTTCTLRTSEASPRDLLREESRAALRYAPGSALQPGGDRVRQRRGEDLWMAASGGDAPTHRVAVCQGPEAAVVEARVVALVSEGEGAWGPWRGRVPRHPTTGEPMAVPLGCVPERGVVPGETLRCGTSTLSWVQVTEEEAQALLHEDAAGDFARVAEAEGWTLDDGDVRCAIGGETTRCRRAHRPPAEGESGPSAHGLFGYAARGGGDALFVSCRWWGDDTPPGSCGALIDPGAATP